MKKCTFGRVWVNWTRRRGVGDTVDGRPEKWTKEEYRNYEYYDRSIVSDDTGYNPAQISSLLGVSKSFKKGTHKSNSFDRMLAYLRQFSGDRADSMNIWPKLQLAFDVQFLALPERVGGISVLAVFPG
jgi:hypothetical protein